MDLDYYIGAVLSPHFIASMAAAGVGYGFFLWVVDIRDCVRLYAIATVPGLAFLAFVFLARLTSGGSAVALYPLLMLDWMVFANVAYLTVMVRRRIVRRRRNGTGGKG